MDRLALTRASTLGPVVDQLRRAGASVARVFNAADLPLEMMQRPSALIPLRDHYRIVEYAARELGDNALPARLALAAGIDGLGIYGARFVRAPTLGKAIEDGNRMLASVLQSGTRMALTVEKGVARWTYEVLERQAIGRQRNEILALGYMLDSVRRFAGATWTPGRVQVPGGALAARSQIEALYQCEIGTGDRLAVSMPSATLEIPGRHVRALEADGSSGDVPDWHDIQGCVRELIRLGLLKRRPSRRWVAEHLGLSVRTMQRHLSRRQVSYRTMLRDTILQQARDMLSRSISITATAVELGYSDAAHLSRAFRRALAVSPRAWRRAGAP